MNEQFQLSESAARKTAKTVRRVENWPWGVAVGLPHSPVSNHGLNVKTDADGITGMVDNKPGVGEVTLYRLRPADDNNPDAELVEVEIEKRDCYNLSPFPIGAEIYVEVNFKGGYMWVKDSEEGEGVLDEDLESGSTATMSIWSDDADTDEDLEVSAWLLPSGKKLEADTRVVVRRIGSEYRVISANNCPVDV